MIKYMKSVALFLTGLALMGFMAKAPSDESLDIGDQAWAWSHMQAGMIAQERILSLSMKNKAKDSLITNVNVIELPEGTVRRAAAVLVRSGRVIQIMDAAEGRKVRSVARIDGGGGFLAPGLTDMHVHTHDDADYLLQLSAGVTTIREMNGWLWRLKRRALLENGALLAPNMNIAGRILNSSDFGGYAIPIDGPEEARAAVRQTRDDGYDAVKIHNGLSNDEFHAIAEESNNVGLKLVGHIPVRVSVAEAIAAGMHTAEHFKGYIDDSRLEISTGDWLTPSIGMSMYLTPTFYAYKEHLRGDEARQIIAANAGRVPPYHRAAWQAYANAEPDGLDRLRQTIRPKSEEIFKTLLPHGIKWLAGTDSGGYELMVPGEALIEELEIMQGLGLSTLETLKAATSNAAEAMGWQGRTGRIAPGYSADFVLLEKNPLQTVANLRTPKAVMIRGTWLDDPQGLAMTPADYVSMETRVSRRLLKAEVEKAEAHDRAGYAQSTMSLTIWADMMDVLGQEDLGQRLRTLEIKRCCL